MNFTSLPRTHRARCALCAATALAALLSIAPPADSAERPVAPYPDWWARRGVLAPGADTNDFAAATAGQVKWLFRQAVNELDASLPGGAGPDLGAAVSALASTSNCVAVTAGELKSLVAPLVARIAEAGYLAESSWSAATDDDVDTAAVNLGQVKQAFSFAVTGDLVGRVDYSGPQTGRIWVVALPLPAGWAATNRAALAGPGPFRLSDLPNTTAYWLKAFRDTNANGAPDGAEPTGLYAGNPVVLHRRPASIGIVLRDGDGDGDGMADWWETLQFGNLDADGDADADADALSNAAEYALGTGALDADSDGDGVADGADGAPLAPVDADADGLPDDWERFWFASTGGGDVDSDGDGRADRAEWAAGTDPTRHDQPGAAETRLDVFSPVMREGEGS